LLGKYLARGEIMKKMLMGELAVGVWDMEGKG
jgi:hypothetical protein